MGRIDRKPGGLLDALIKASRGQGQAPAKALLEDVAEMLAHDGAGDVDEDRLHLALELLERYRRSGDLNASEAGTKELRRPTLSGSFHLTRSFVGSVPLRGHITRQPPVYGTKQAPLTVDLFSVTPPALVDIEEWLKKQDLWPELAAMWCRETAPTAQTVPEKLELCSPPEPIQPKTPRQIVKAAHLPVVLFKILEVEGYTLAQIKTWVNKPKCHGLDAACTSRGVYDIDMSLEIVRRKAPGDDSVAKQQRRAKLVKVG